MKKKPLIVALSVVAGIVLVYCASWFFFYNAICKPLIPTELTGFMVEENDYTKHTRYTCDENGYSYTLNIPHFGRYSCFVQVTSNLIMPSPDEIEQYSLSEEDAQAKLESGSKFMYSLRIPIGWNGKMRSISVNSSVLSEEDIPKYGMGMLFAYDTNGEMKGKDDLSNQELEMYREANEEIQEIIQDTKRIFSIR